MDEGRRTGCGFVNLLVLSSEIFWTHGVHTYLYVYGKNKKERKEERMEKKIYAHTREDMSIRIVGNGFICVYYKIFFTSNPGVRVKRIFFFVCLFA